MLKVQKLKRRKIKMSNANDKTKDNSSLESLIPGAHIGDIDSMARKKLPQAAPMEGSPDFIGPPSPPKVGQ